MNYVESAASFLFSASSTVVEAAKPLLHKAWNGTMYAMREYLRNITPPSEGTVAKGCRVMQEYFFRPEPTFTEKTQKYLGALASTSTGLTCLGHTITLGEATSTFLFTSTAAYLAGRFIRSKQQPKKDDLPERVQEPQGEKNRDNALTQALNNLVTPEQEHEAPPPTPATRESLNEQYLLKALSYGVFLNRPTQFTGSNK